MPPPALDVAPTAKPADAALNGAQVSSMLEIAERYRNGVLDRSSAIALMTTAFPIGRAQAEEILGPPRTNTG